MMSQSMANVSETPFVPINPNAQYINEQNVYKTLAPRSVPSKAVQSYFPSDSPDYLVGSGRNIIFNITSQQAFMDPQNTFLQMQAVSANTFTQIFGGEFISTARLFLNNTLVEEITNAQDAGVMTLRSVSRDYATSTGNMLGTDKITLADSISVFLGAHTGSAGHTTVENVTRNYAIPLSAFFGVFAQPKHLPLLGAPLIDRVRIEFVLSSKAECGIFDVASPGDITLSNVNIVSRMVYLNENITQALKQQALTQGGIQLSFVGSSTQQYDVASSTGVSEAIFSFPYASVKAIVAGCKNATKTGANVSKRNFILNNITQYQWNLAGQVYPQNPVNANDAELLANLQMTTRKVSAQGSMYGVDGTTIIKRTATDTLYDASALLGLDVETYHSSESGLNLQGNANQVRLRLTRGDATGAVALSVIAKCSFDALLTISNSQVIVSY